MKWPIEEKKTLSNLSNKCLHCYSYSSNFYETILFIFSMWMIHLRKCGNQNVLERSQVPKTIENHSFSSFHRYYYAIVLYKKSRYSWCYRMKQMKRKSVMNSFKWSNGLLKTLQMQTCLFKVTHSLIRKAKLSEWRACQATSMFDVPYKIP